MARTVYGDHEQYLSPYFTQIPGMFFTADEAMKDEDGYFRLLGRIDTVVHVSGHRIGTKEIESALEQHRQVLETAVVGYPHPIKRQGLYAFVAVKSGTLISEELKKELILLVRREIGPIATLDRIQWTSSLPKTRSGKILRTVLEKIAAGAIEDIGDISAIADRELIEDLIKNRMPGEPS
jgi:acetyl-CoA synthetase